MPAPTPDPIIDAVRMLRSAFPRTQFNVQNGQITGGGIVLSGAEIARPHQQLVQLAASRLKAIEEQQAAAARTAAEGASNASGT